MATIGILCDTEDGHILPTFQVAKALAARGHDVFYTGFSSVAATVRNQGFRFECIPETGLDLDNETERVSRGAREKGHFPTRRMYFGKLVNGGLLRENPLSQGCNLLLVPYYYYLEALVIHYLYGVPVVFLVPDARSKSRRQHALECVTELCSLTDGLEGLLELVAQSGAEIRKLDDLAELLLWCPELVFHPQAYATSAAEPLSYYAGSSVDLNRLEGPLDLGRLDPARPVIYCSLGSRGCEATEVRRRFFGVALEVMAQHPEWQMVIATSRWIDPSELPPPPSNTVVRNWVPQLRVLERSEVMITNGGFGTVKEGILMGVPMVVFPIVFDQFESASRVVSFDLGVQGEVSRVAPRQLSELIQQVRGNQNIRERLGRMRAEFMATNGPETAVSIIESALSETGFNRKEGQWKKSVA